ncbi:fatty acid desaturase family protein [Sandaracinus amylolyticus]|uniref:Putative LINOLEOYL-CoA DESATURASE (DELTA(6)-DESATURASE) n=1 Tax=Sandaracinus amylolyticus TaxID=927083 RepID=A0A0F6W0L2_9BACT|nr:acyl-CoA desaturase [Sandaracinus amylolyticus]AKF04443.1 Putative LINOLEOYL-CoA DESATURASE (DELTA(6)-DESATURASE) [Sandaracinus amylolyticus]
MTPSRALTTDEADALGRELDAIRDEVIASLGQRDVDHIRGVMRAASALEIAGRTLLHVGIDPISFVVGAGALGISKILENMEIGHNVMHGQYDWTGDPALRSSTYEWDIACTSDDWRRSHNYEHHTFTNILGKDRDVGYMFLRVAPEQAWRPSHLSQPLVAAGLALSFQWGVGTHELRIFETMCGDQSWRELARRARPFLAKAKWQLAKDYLFFPALALWNAPRVIAGNLVANGTRNVWAFAIIFCGHFPEGVRVYREDETEHESRGEWYVRQINGSANIEGERWMHLLSGHLSHQIEHHLFPDLPASRYPEVAPRVRALCERYGQTYRSAPLLRQLASVGRQIVRLALP